MPEQADSIQFVADRGDSRLRLDQVLVRRVTAISRMSRAIAQRWISHGAVDVDGQPAARASVRLREGAAVRVRLPPDAPRRVRPEGEPVDLDVRYEDDALVVINKPAGIVVHPSYKQAHGTLLNGVLWRTRSRTDVQPGILTRLDKDTSGLVVVALSAPIHATLQRDASAGRIRKQYLAIVHGVPEPDRGRIVHPLSRDPRDRRRVIVSADGAPSETRYTTLRTLDVHAVSPATSERISLVECELVTGRTHQIRVHLSATGTPIVGDRVYGTAHPAIARQALHAWRITLPHPTTREEIAIEAPLPEDMRTLLER